MRKILFFVLLSFLIFIIPVLFSREQDNYLPVSSLKAGMKGYGLTVFQGTEPEKFYAEILGIMHNSRVKGDIIIARLSGGPLEKSGVIAGMSGSPVYVSNRLIGAVAFSWAFSKEPIAGITPIKDMLLTLEHNDPTNDFPQRLQWYPDSFEGQESSQNNSSPHMQNLMTPLSITGLDESLFNVIDPLLREQGFIPVLGGQASGRKFLPLSESTNKFIPGSAVGISLISGDLNMSGVGTVTWQKGKELLVFGHPMYQRGNCRFPVTTADIITVMPGYEISFKMASAGDLAGSTIQDRRNAVSCSLGGEAETVPVHISQEYRGETKEFNYTIVRDPLYFQKFLTICIANTLVYDKAPLERNSLLISMKIRLDTGEEIVWNDLFSELTTSANAWSAVTGFSAPIRDLMLNPFKEVNITGIDVEIHHSDEIRVTDVSKLRILSQGPVYPGDELLCRVTLSSWQGQTWTTNIPFLIPENMEPGPFMIIASSAKEERFTDTVLASERFHPQSWEQMIKLLGEQDRNNELVLWGITRKRGLILNGEKYPNLPDSRFNILQSAREDSSSPMAVKMKYKTVTPWYIYGFRRVEITIEPRKFWRDK